MNLDGKKYKLVAALEEALALGTPSMARCTNLKVEGYVYFSKRNVLVGKVTLMNASKEPKVLPPGTYENCTVDLSAAPGLGALCPAKAKTAPIADQKPGTSGLRKKTRVFMEGTYLHNFVQATFNTVKASARTWGTRRCSSAATAVTSTRKPFKSSSKWRSPTA
jgi:hypothetical protein